jgi:hypothetical protein
LAPELIIYEFEEDAVPVFVRATVIRKRKKESQWRKMMADFGVDERICQCPPLSRQLDTDEACWFE